MIATKGTPWKDLVDHNCGWWIDLGVDALEAALREALELPSETLSLKGRDGRCLVERKYMWKAVAEIVMNGYQEAKYGT